MELDVVKVIKDHYPILIPVLCRMIVTFLGRRQFSYLADAVKRRVLNGEKIPSYLIPWLLLDYLLWILIILSIYFELYAYSM